MLSVPKVALNIVGGVEAFISTLVNEVQPVKALSSILVTFLGIVIFVKALQFINAPS